MQRWKFNKVQVTRRPTTMSLLWLSFPAALFFPSPYSIT